MDRNKKITRALGQSSNIQNIDILAVVSYHLYHCSIQYEIVRGQSNKKCAGWIKSSLFAC